MGLGKTVMTISLILARPHKGTSENEDEDEFVKKENSYETTNSRRPQGGTLIICPMALLSQWKVGLLDCKIKEMHLFYILFF